MGWSRLLALLATGVLVAGACSSGGDDAEPAAADEIDESGDVDEEPSADCEPARDVEVTDEAQTFSFDGDERAYLLALPDDHDGATAHPLVFNFHGFSGNKEGQEVYTAMAEAGTDRGYVVVTPDAMGDPRDWNYFADEERADDFGFIDALVDDLSERLCIDPDRVYAAGHSAGSAFVGFLVCREPYRYAAVAMVAAFIPTTCPPEEAAPSAIAFHGTDDALVPYGGGQVGDSSTQIPGAFDTLDQYADHYGCDQPALEGEAADDVETHTLTGCAQDSEVVFYTIVGGGHGWPGNTAGNDIGGQPDSALGQFPATDTILDFFDEHSR